MLPDVVPNFWELDNVKVPVTSAPQEDIVKAERVEKRIKVKKRLMFAIIFGFKIILVGAFRARCACAYMDVARIKSVQRYGFLSDYANKNEKKCKI